LQDVYIFVIVKPTPHGLRITVTQLVLFWKFFIFLPKSGIQESYFAYWC